MGWQCLRERDFTVFPLLIRFNNIRLSLYMQLSLLKSVTLGPQHSDLFSQVNSVIHKSVYTVKGSIRKISLS